MISILIVSIKEALHRTISHYITLYCHTMHCNRLPYVALYDNDYAYRSKDQTDNRNHSQDQTDNENYSQDDSDNGNRYQDDQLLNTDAYPSLIFFTALFIMGWGLLFSYP